MGGVPVSSSSNFTWQWVRDAYVKINVLIVEESRFEDVKDWGSRADFVHDSYLVNEHVGETISQERQAELQQAKEEIQKPGINGDRVLLVIQEVDMLYGPLR